VNETIGSTNWLFLSRRSSKSGVRSAKGGVPSLESIKLGVIKNPELLEIRCSWGQTELHF